MRKQLADVVTGLRFYLDSLNRLNRLVGGDSLERFARSDCFHGNPVIERGAMGLAFAQHRQLIKSYKATSTLTEMLFPEVEYWVGPSLLHSNQSTLLWQPGLTILAEPLR